MADDQMPTKLMNFISEELLKETRRTRGVRVEDGTAQRDRSLYEILQENKDKKDAEFNERFKHRPPKALDEDETEFLDKLEMLRKEYEQQLADEEKLQLESFQAAVAAQSTAVHELKEAPSVSKVQEKKSILGTRNTAARPLGMLIKVNPQTKKAKMDFADAEEASTVDSGGFMRRKAVSWGFYSVEFALYGNMLQLEYVARDRYRLTKYREMLHSVANSLEEATSKTL